MGGILLVNVTIYGIHGSYGYVVSSQIPVQGGQESAQIACIMTERDMFPDHVSCSRATVGRPIGRPLRRGNPQWIRDKILPTCPWFVVTDMGYPAESLTFGLYSYVISIKLLPQKISGRNLAINLRWLPFPEVSPNSHVFGAHGLHCTLIPRRGEAKLVPTASLNASEHLGAGETQMFNYHHY